MSGDRQFESSLPISLFDYDLPDELIAQHPLQDRTSSRLLVLDRNTETIVHSRFADIDQWLRRGDLLVLNDTRVFPARVMARRRTGGTIEMLFLRAIDGDEWQAMVRPARRLREQEKLRVLDHNDSETDLSVVLREKREDGTVVLFAPDAEQILEIAGRVPLPGYITSPLNDSDRYQTVYARESGSVAAPTAGLHFTQDMIDHLQGRGVEIAWVTLHVGPGTFQPVKTEDALQHVMHGERYVVSVESSRQVRKAKAERRRVIAVGTTSCRTLESIADRLGQEDVISGETSLYITPGYEFKIVDGLLTNFHLPKSTLLLLVSALAGRELVLRSYREAVAERYRFFSFGDAMLIL